MPHTPTKYASTIVKLIDSATPRKKAQLEAVNIATTSADRSAKDSIVKASAKAAESNVVVKQSLVKELNKEKGKARAHKYLPISKSTLYRKRKGNVGRPVLRTDDKLVIGSFFSNPENITIYPNKRRKNSTDPLKVLNFTKKQLFLKFCELFPNIRVSLSTFWKYKPKCVKRKAAARLLQCVCDICENISLILSSIRRSMNRSGYVTENIPDDQGRLALLTLCQSKLHLPKCLSRQCSDCGVQTVVNLFREWAEDVPNDMVNYPTWKVMESVINNKATRRLTKVMCSETRRGLLDLLVGKLESYGRHIFVARSQTAAYQDCYSNLNENECCVVVDFAENYTCLRQGEAQSAYYSRNQVTLHPMVLVVPNEGGIIRDSVCAISNDLKHDATAVKEFFSALFLHINIMYPNINKVHVWSDGCSAQYKSKLPFYHISQAFDSNYEVVWNFFGSRHGKSAADGEAAVIKTFLRIESTKNDLILDNAQQVFDHLSRSHLHTLDGSSRRHFYYLSSNSIDAKRQETRLTTIAGTRLIHQITQGPTPGSVCYKGLSCYCLQFPCFHSFNEWKNYKFKGNGSCFLLTILVFQKN